MAVATGFPAQPPQGLGFATVDETDIRLVAVGIGLGASHMDRDALAVGGINSIVPFKLGSLGAAHPTEKQYGDKSSIQ